MCVLLVRFLSQNQGSPGYDVNDFYPRSSYLYDFVATTRRQGILLGESSLPVAVYIQSAYLFKPATQQARIQRDPSRSCPRRNDP